MNYDNYYKNGGMTKEESVSAIALRIGARKEAVAKFVEQNNIDTNKLNSDLKSGEVYFLDVITAIVGTPDNKYEKQIVKKYGNKMAMGGMTKEKEKLSNLTYQLVNTEDSFKKNNPEAYSRMKDAYKEQFIKVYGKDEYYKRHIMAMGGKTQGYDDREDERLAMEYGKMSGKDFVGSHDRREHSRRDDARFEERMARGGYVSKGELVWKKLTNYERMKFLHENFTPQITPRSQEILVGKDYNFLPKNVKIVMESKYANVENYANGGEVYYVRDFYPNYDEDKIADILKSIGAKKVRKAKLYGYSNQPDVVVFEGDKNKAQEVLEKEFPDNYISIYEKDWGRKMADGGMMENEDYDDEPSEEMIKLLQEHEKEAKKNRVKITNLGSNSGDDFIASKTTQRKDGSDFLTSEISDGVITHYWEEFKNGGMMADGGEVGDKVQLIQGLRDENIFRNFPEGEYEIKKIIKGNDTFPEGFYEIENKDGRRTQLKKSRFSSVSSKGFMADGGEIKVINLSDDDKLTYFINKQDLVEKKDPESDDYKFIYDMLTTTYDGKKFYSLGYDTPDKGHVFSLEEAKKNARIITDSQLGQKWDVIIKEVGGAFGEQDFTKKQYVVMTSPLFPREMLREMRYTLKYAKGGAIEDQYVGRTAQDIWDSLSQNQRSHFIYDHAIEIEMLKDKNFDDDTNKFPKEMTSEFIKKAYRSDWKDLDEVVQNRFSNHVRKGEYAKGGVMAKGGKTEKKKFTSYTILDADEYGNRDSSSKKKPTKFYIVWYGNAYQLFMDKPNTINSRAIFDNDDELKKAIDKVRYSTPTYVNYGLPQDQKFYKEFIVSEKFEYGKGGALSEQNQLNKKVLALIQKANIESKLEFGQLVVSALTDANFHSEVRKFISIIENKPEWEKEPKLDYNLPFEKLEKERAKTVYSSKYYDANEKIDDLGRKIASMSGWEFETILDSLIFASKMIGRNDVAQVLEKLNSDDDKQDTTKNKWEYTDVDEIDYVIVKDKSGKELKFDGKYVISGVHDLLEKGGKLTEIGKYYSKNNVVSVVVNGKNILDKNTVSGVWIKKDAKPMAEDVADIKIGKTTIKKGVNGWVAKTMVDNFKGFDWDITTIKNSRGDLTTTAQGGKSEDKGGYKMFTFKVFQDPAIRLKSSRPARVTDKVVSAQHEEAMKDFKERQDEIAEMVDQIQAKKKMADGGAIGFDALAKKVAKNYEGDKVKKEYQNEYGKKYDKQEAEEVGKKVAAKVYRQQQAKGKMAKGGDVAKKSTRNSTNKMTRIARKASEIRKANEPWKDAFNRAKAMID